MSAITFPNSPSADDQHTVNGITYTFTDGTWVAVGQSNFYSLPIASPTTLGGIKGGGTDITIANDGVISFSGTLPGPKTFTFTATSDGNNGYTVTGNDRRGIVSGTNPTIHINEEDTIIFNVNSGPFHVLWAHGINYSTSQVGSGQGVNTASGNGTSNGSVTWVTAVNDGLSLYQGGAQFFYQDSNQDFANNPTTYKYGTINVYLKDTPEGKGDWLELNDTPNSFSGQAGKFTKVNSTEDGLEFTDGSAFNASDVDAHLNQSNPTSGYVLSWNGTDYEWVPKASTPFTTISTDKSTSHTLLASDIGNVVRLTSPGGGVNLSLIIPNLSASLSFGDEVRILNGAAENISIDTGATSGFYWGISGSGGQPGGYSTGNRQIAGHSLITLTYKGNNQWNIHGDGVF
tara:strand:- start:379 stop:1584 length:1206 start_codon:yes stop_codon:yes gene_type:complete